MYINKRELNLIKQGLELVYFCDDLPVEKRKLLASVQTAIRDIERRYAIQKDTDRKVQNEHRKVRRAKNGARAKRFSVQVGEGTDWIYFDKPQELHDLLGVRVKSITQETMQRELRRQLGRIDIFVKRLEESKMIAAKRKAAGSTRWQRGRRKGSQRKEVEELPDFNIDNEDNE